MKTRYLILRGCEPIRVDFKDEVNLMFAIMGYVDCYGDTFIGLANDYNETLEMLTQDYLELYSDDNNNDTVRVKDILFLEDCLRLDYEKYI